MPSLRATAPLRPLVEPTTGPATDSAGIAVLIPCYNEQATIAAVVSDFRAALPAARIYVYDNNSEDGTASVGREAGAVVRFERLQGKGNVVRRMFADVDAEVYVLVDGDGTYDAGEAARLVGHLCQYQLDLVNAARIGDHARRGHRLGNDLFNRVVGRVFGHGFGDMLSGYKVFSRRFVKSFPALASGFEIEAELTIHALRLRMPVAELPTRYAQRPEGSTSKLRTLRDGFRIAWTIFKLVKEERPLAFFATIWALLTALSLGLAAPIALTFLATGLVPRLPTAVLAVGVMLLGFLSLACGLVLDTVTRGRTELKRLHYLALPAAGGGTSR
jgi:glycosyltransferase involved in cell wall biosynthesis